MEKQSASQKRIFPVYGPTWVDKLRHSGRKMTTNWFKVTIICQSDSKMTPKWRLFAKKSECWWFVLPHNFIKPLKYVGNMNVSWKQTFMYPKWLHNYLKVDPKWSKVTFIRQKWPQNDPKVIPKSIQNDFKSPSYVEIAAKNFPKWIQSGPEMISKWPKLSLICQEWPQSHPKPPNVTQKLLRVHAEPLKSRKNKAK